MFIVFEGIDGSGKTTLSNLVAKRLREGGLAVEHVREGGTFASSVTQAMRELGRDSRNLALTPRAELMLYLAREVQLLDEATRPALGRAEIVLADRFVQTAECLAIYGRGLPAADVTPIVESAVSGFTPDLTILVDVEPRIARARRQVSKLAEETKKLPSRKGLAGGALQRRLRDGYRELAEKYADRWVVIDNTDAELLPTVELLVDIIRTAHAKTVAAARALRPTTRTSRLDTPRVSDRDSARTALLDWIDRRAAREPGLAAYFLDGLHGPELDARRRALAATAPHVIAAGLKYLDDAVSWELRHELAATAPRHVARSIAGENVVARAEASALLRALLERVPLEVGHALRGRDDREGWLLRAELRDDAVLASLGGVDGNLAWGLRETWLVGIDFDRPDRAALAAASVAGVPGERAWEIRKRARAHAPVAAIESTYGLTDERAWKWRDRYAERAPKAVMKSIGELDHPRAWDLRERLADRVEDVLDSMVGLDDPRGWALRSASVERWPATVVKSLGPLAASERGRAIVTAAIAAGGTDLALWRQLVLHT